VPIAARAEAPLQLGRLGDADAPADDELERLRAGRRWLDADRAVQQRGGVEVEADPEGLAELARARAQLLEAIDAARARG
jgi:hypothetical protein